MGLGVFDQYVVAGREMHAVGVDVADHEVAQDDAMGLVAAHAMGAAVDGEAFEDEIDVFTWCWSHEAT